MPPLATTIGTELTVVKGVLSTLGDFPYALGACTVAQPNYVDSPKISLSYLKQGAIARNTDCKTAILP